LGALLGRSIARGYGNIGPLSEPAGNGRSSSARAHLATDKRHPCAPKPRLPRTIVTVIVLGVWAVTSDAIGWLSG
jgi:hypothetical protein